MEERGLGEEGEEEGEEFRLGLAKREEGWGGGKSFPFLS